MIDKDKIVKLVKLANNNSSEHESNSSAREVCRILERENWEGLFKVIKPILPKHKPYSKPGRVSDPIREQGKYDPFGTRK